MKKGLKFFGGIVLILLLSLLGFYFWAQQANLSPDEYYDVRKYNNTSQERVDSTLRIMTYNIGYLSGMTNNLAIKVDENLYQENLKHVIASLKKIKPDVVGMQEIDFDSKRSYEMDENNVIASQLFAYSAKAVNWDKKYVPFPYWPIDVNFGKIVSGQSVMSNYELRDNHALVLQKVKSKPFYYNAFYLDRLAQLVHCKHPVKDFSIINIHVEAFDQATRIEQLKTVRNLVKEEAKNSAVIVLGDFNSDPSTKNAACEIFLRDSLLACAGGLDRKDYEKTFPSEKPIERLDYIFYTKKDFKEGDAFVARDFEQASDHLPFFAELKFR
jgi:endonuclease/exonuclease/phosphatase family metal-dependent hydrolase